MNNNIKILNMKFFLLSIVFLLALSFASAYGFDVAYNPIKNEIYMNEGAVFEVTVVNNLNTPNRLRFSVGDFTEWSVETDPQSYKLSGALIDAKESETFKLIFYPKNIRHGQKSVKITAKSDNTKEEIRKYIKINLRSEYTIPSYSPDLGLKIYLPDKGKLDPRKQHVFRIEVKNKNLLKLEDISLNLKSNLIEEGEKGIILDALQRKVIDFAINFNPVELPRKDTLVVTATIENKTFVSIEDFYIASYHEDFLQKEDITRKILKTIKNIRVTNTANVAQEGTIKVETSFLRSFFSYTKPRAEVVEEGKKRFFVWSLGLAPQETKTLSAVLSFRPVFFILLIIVIAIAAYFYLRSPLIAKKSYSNVSTKEGGISKLTLILNIKNRSKRVLNNVEIIDKVPRIADVRKEFKVGSLHPTKIIKHDRKGTLLKWEIEALEPGEERILSYSIKSKLSILGVFSIPAAAVKYKTKQGSRSVVRSNSLNISR